MAARGQDVRQLLLQVDASVALAQRKMGELARSVEADTGRMDRSLSRIEGSTGRLGSGFDRLSGTLARFGVALGVGTIATAATSLFNYTASLSEAAQAAGVTVEQLQILRRAARDTGASQEGLERSLAILNRTLGQARAGIPAAVQAFRALRIDPEQFSNAGDVMPLVMERIAGIGTASEQAAIAQRLFGRGASELIPLLSQGADGYEQYASKAREAGLITQEMADAADRASDRLAAMGETIRSRLIVAGFQAHDWMMDFTAGLRDLASEAGNALSRLLGLDEAMRRPPPRSAFMDRATEWGQWLMGGWATDAAGDVAQRGRNRRAAREGPGAGVGAATGAARLLGLPASAEGDDLDLSTAGARRRASGSGRSGAGSRVSEAEIREIVRELGSAPGSMRRSRAHNAAVGGAPNSFHLSGQAVDFGLRRGLTRERIREAFAARGIDLAELLGPGDAGHDDHWHAAWGSSRRGGRSGADSAAREAERAAEAQEAALGSLRAATGQQAEQQRLQAMRARGLEDEAELEGELGERRRAYADQLGRLTETQQEAQRRLTPELREQLNLYEQQAQAFADLIGERGNGKDLTDEQRAAEEAAATAMAEALQGARALGTTAEDYLETQLSIVRADDKIEAARDRSAANAAREAMEREKALEIEEQISRELEERKQEANAQAEAQVEELADLYERLFSGNVGDIWDQFKREGLRTIALLAAQWTIAMLTNQPFSLSGQMKGDDGGFLSLIGSLLGNSGGIPYGGGKAVGGPVRSGMAYLVGERGPEIVVPKAPGIVIPNHALGAGGGRSTIRLELSGDIDARMVRVASGVSIEVVRAAAPGIEAGAARRTMESLARPELA